MSFISFIANRYSQESRKAFFVNLISKFALLMLAFGMCFQIIVFAGYNGLTSTLKNALSLFDPELRITHKDDMFFQLDSTQYNQIMGLSNIDLISRVIEGDIGMKYRDDQMVSKFMGVDENFKQLNRIDTSILIGTYQLYSNSKDFALIGLGLKNRLDITMRSHFQDQGISLFYPNRHKRIRESSKSFNRSIVYPKAIYSIEPRFDNSLIISYELATQLTDHTNEYTSLHIKSSAGEIEKLKPVLEHMLGEKFEIKTRTEQRESLFKALKTEELIVKIILIFLLILCSLSVYLSILMTVISKKKDFALFLSWGASSKQIRNIILLQAIRLAVKGILIGAALGTALVYLQNAQITLDFFDTSLYLYLAVDNFGSPFPVKSLPFDYLFSVSTTLLISCGMAILPSRKASSISINSNI